MHGVGIADGWAFVSSDSEAVTTEFASDDPLQLCESASSHVVRSMVSRPVTGRGNGGYLLPHDVMQIRLLAGQPPGKSVVARGLDVDAISDGDGAVSSSRKRKRSHQHVGAALRVVLL